MRISARGGNSALYASVNFSCTRIPPPHPWDWKGEQMPRSSPGGGGGVQEVGAAGIDWCINLKCFIHVKITNLLWINK